MSRSETNWGNPSIQQRNEISIFNTNRRAHYERLLTFEEKSFQARTLNQYLEILTHNGALNILENANVIVDAGCGGMMALAGMRETYRQNRVLWGFDMFNIPEVSVRFRNGQTILGQDLIGRFDLRFVQGTYSQLPNLIPGGYDALIAIPLFTADDWKSSYPLDIFEKMYKGLHSYGRIQTILEMPKDLETRILHSLALRKMKYTFTPGNLELLNQHALYTTDEGNPMGTLTLGPK